MSTTLAPNRPQPSSGNDLIGAACLNCGTPLAGPFCSECGQRDLPAEPPVGELASEAWGEFVSIDGKVAATLLRLFLRPGALTREYLTGRRARFLPPLRLYLLCSVAFFLAEAWSPTHNGGLTISTVPAAQDSIRFQAQLDSIRARKATAFEKRLKVNQLRIAHDHHDFGQEYQAQIPRLMFVLMPAFAALLMMIYRSRRRRFAAHLIFSLHLHAFFFVTLSILALGAWIPRPERHFVSYPLAAWFVFYIPAALREFYGGRVSATLARTALLLTMYLAVIGLGLGVMGGLLIYFY